MIKTGITQINVTNNGIHFSCIYYLLRSYWSGSCADVSTLLCTSVCHNNNAQAQCSTVGWVAGFTGRPSGP